MRRWKKSGEKRCVYVVGGGGGGAGERIGRKESRAREGSRDRNYEDVSKVLPSYRQMSARREIKIANVSIMVYQAE